MIKWLQRRAKTARIRARREKRVADYRLPFLIAQRLKLRVEEAAEKRDLERMKTLLSRIRKVRDWQLRCGHG